MGLKNTECSPGTVGIHPNCSSFIPKNVAQNAAEKCGMQSWNCRYPRQLLRFYSEKCGPKCGPKMWSAVQELRISMPTALVLFQKMWRKMWLRNEECTLELSISIPTAPVLFHKMQLKNAECSTGTVDIHPNCSGFIPKNAAHNAAEKCRVQPWNCRYPPQLLQFYSEKCGPKCG